MQSTMAAELAIRAYNPYVNLLMRYKYIMTRIEWAFEIHLQFKHKPDDFKLKWIIACIEPFHNGNCFHKVSL